MLVDMPLVPLASTRPTLRSRAARASQSGVLRTVELREPDGRESIESLVPGQPVASERERLERLERRAAQTERLASIGTMAAGIAHEINNPLMYVLANTSFGVETLDRHVAALHVLEASGTTGLAAALAELAELRTALLEATEGVERVRTIVADLRRFARAEGVEASPLVLADVVVRAARMSAGVVAPRARLRTELGRTPIVRGSEGMLVQVLTNVLVNAAEAMGDGAKPGEILVRTSTNRRGEAVIEVLDDGPGFTAEALDRLFDPFFTTKPVGAGTGLGLSISHGAVRAMGGRITADNRVEGGAVVRIVLPAAREDDRSETRSVHESGPERVARVVPQELHRPNVLVIDDDPIVGRSIVRLLRSSTEAVSVSSGREAQALLAGGRDFDVIFCDLMMPDVSGADVHAWITRERPELASRVVFLSGGATTEEAQRFLECSAPSWLTKPVPANVLRDLVAERTKHRAGHDEPPTDQSKNDSAHSNARARTIIGGTSPSAEPAR
jgi:signal transduction histidine kinase/CheY-like chemotaxis protein